MHVFEHYTIHFMKHTFFFPHHHSNTVAVFTPPQKGSLHPFIHCQNWFLPMTGRPLLADSLRLLRFFTNTLPKNQCLFSKPDTYLGFHCSNTQLSGTIKALHVAGSHTTTGSISNSNQALPQFLQFQSPKNFG